MLFRSFDRVLAADIDDMIGAELLAHFEPALARAGEDDGRGTQGLRDADAHETDRAWPHHHDALASDEPTQLGFRWHSILMSGQKVGAMTNCVWSYRLKRNIGFALVSTACLAGHRVEVVKEGVPLAGTLSELPFL